MTNRIILPTRDLAGFFARRLAQLRPDWTAYWLIWMLQTLESIAIDHGQQEIFDNVLDSISADLTNRIQSGHW